MCGITGIVSWQQEGAVELNRIERATRCIHLRGPDHEGFFRDVQIALGHRRLSVIDVSPMGNQPMKHHTGRYIIVFNGEFFNYREHRDELKSKGENFLTESDTEVVLALYARHGTGCLKYMNGFFAFAIYDILDKTLFIARDRMGIKPLFYHVNKTHFSFASEMKALLELGAERNIDRTSLLNYLQLNYIPGPWSIFEGVKKLSPGHFLYIKLNDVQSEISEERYYSIPDRYHYEKTAPDYEASCHKLSEILEDAVNIRMVSDVPLGAFLSGGIDSSIIVALASRHTQKLNTFSIGFRDEPLYDETRFAQLVADRYKTYHTVFSLTTDDLLNHLDQVLSYLDEPFADSSAIAVYILSQYTRKHVTVSLSGDGADEMFGGYNKHRAEWVMRNQPSRRLLAGVLSPLLSSFEGGRHTSMGNRIRQIHRFAEGASMTTADRYWRWCAYAGEKEIDDVIDFAYDNGAYFRRKKMLLEPIGTGNDMNDIFRQDMHLVLPNDMLVKVDMMSMANSLEVRVPFLDYRLVDFAFSIPSHFKIDSGQGKKILRDTFRNDLPLELFNRGKHGFEVPLLKWFRNELRSRIESEWLSEEMIDRQGLFHYPGIARLKQKLFSDNPGETEGRIWGLIVFQNWWMKYMD
jgi:asparagine synthase (glutamine-hydrolysing)